ncbi:hypothetical protein, partial [Ralstonia solanacearum]|uniref:hypothetical protein n=1 Tax=Ralstonia solanacearum TaxID=305 RepID=UPI001E33F7C8
MEAQVGKFAPQCIGHIVAHRVQVVQHHVEPGLALAPGGHGGVDPETVDGAGQPRWQARMEPVHQGGRTEIGDGTAQAGDVEAL